MIPLFVIALALSAAALTYEVSPKAHAWVDAHVQAIQSALAAHRAADAHLAAARTAADPGAAVQYARAAAAAQREAARQTATAAKTARTEAQRQAAAQSATAIVVREDAITDTWTDAHLGAADVEPDPIVAVQHVHEAAAANQTAAQKTATAAATAMTEQARASAAQRAVKVAARDEKITNALAKFGVGKCGAHTYANVTPQRRDAIIAKLKGAGMSVTGNNPWDVDTRESGVTLRALWDPQTQVLHVIIMEWGSLAAFAGCGVVWDRIDSKLKEVLGS